MIKNIKKISFDNSHIDYVYQTIEPQAVLLFFPERCLVDKVISICKRWVKNTKSNNANTENKNVSMVFVGS